jgi:hypothetical protein
MISTAEEPICAPAPPPEDPVTLIMTRAVATDLVPTLVRPIHLNRPPSAGEPSLWVIRLRLVAAGVGSMLVAFALSCLVASFALERFAHREVVLRLLAVVAAALIIICAAAGGVLAATLVQRLDG